MFYFIEIIGLIISWSVFDKRAKGLRLTYAQLIVIISFVLILMCGVIGSYILKDQFSGINDWTDAIYFTIVTYSTVGYGDIVPHSESAKLFVMSMIFVGLGTFAAMLTFIVGAFVNRIQNILQTFNKGKNI